MIVTLNGFVINDNLSGVFLDTQISGLEFPGLRTSSGNYSGRAGGYVGGQFPGMRSIGLQGKVSKSSVVNLEAVRRDFQAALASDYRNFVYNVTMEIVTNAGAAYVVFAVLDDFEMPITNALFNASYTVELLAGDTIIYDNATGTELTASIPRLTSGGYVYPVVYPVIYSPGSSPTTVTNSGGVPIYPTVTLTGSATNPVLTNRTTGMFTSLVLTTGTSDVITINMNPTLRSILLNGGSVFGSQGSGSSFWSLLQGGNSIALTTSSGSDTVTGLIKWRSGIMGI